MYLILININKVVIFWDSQFLCVTNRINWILMNLVLINAERVRKRVPAISILMGGSGTSYIICGNRNGDPLLKIISNFKISSMMPFYMQSWLKVMLSAMECTK